MATLFIPTPMRRLTGGQSKVKATGKTVSELLAALEQAYPGFAERILDTQGNLKGFVNIFLNDDGIQTLDGLNTPVRDGDRVSIVPALAGGA